MTGGHTTVSHWRLWKVSCRLRSPSSSSTTPSPSFPGISPKPSCTEDHRSPSTVLICPVTMDRPAITNPGEYFNIPCGTELAICSLD